MGKGWLSAVVLLGPLVAAPAGAGEPGKRPAREVGGEPGRSLVLDGGELFSARALADSNRRVQALADRCGQDVVIETYAQIPADRRKSYDPADKAAFFRDWAQERARE